MYNWRSAPWSRIRGALKATLAEWKPGSFGPVDDAVDDMYGVVSTVIDKYIKSSIPNRARVTDSVVEQATLKSL